MSDSRILGVIPARMKSSRFPGKPLADIKGRPMVARVYDAARRSAELTEVVVATDSSEIVEACGDLDIPTIMTDGNHRTGTDRVAEVANKIEAEIYVNIQGDEPLIEPEVIDVAVNGLMSDDHYQVVNLCMAIDRLTDLVDITVPKVVKGPGGRAVFLSRAVIPYPKNPDAADYFRQVCVYAFRPEALHRFAELEPGPVEASEDIELLRFIEHGIPVRMIEVVTRSFGVDTPADLERACRMWTS
ncbi:MAG: 3-deoxy-manno-octulosonate cytidylyltransferase [Deltaproteobacteria bacterium]|nr:3-deoxy-manno-octulosonate cytidylyltransferase [Deltaproteobacteria bacterium]